MVDLARIAAIYDGSDGDATRQLYASLEDLGPIGLVAMNLFRAQKCSARAKVYLGGNGHGSYRSQAYERKQWSMDNLTRILLEHADALSLTWGWQRDDDQAYHAWVLYVDLPNGQVSFHTDRRGVGPDYHGAWDGVRDGSVGRIIRFTAEVLSAAAV